MSDPTIVIVGASRGLGLAIAAEFVGRGWQVIGTVRSDTRTELHDLADAHPDRVEIELAFLKPLRNTQQVEFLLTPNGGGTDVTWRMSGQHEGLMMNLFSKVMSMDKLVGRDFEKGLARLKTAAEAP